jgi:hypothetical protein
MWWFQYVPHALTYRNFALWLHSVFVCYMWFSLWTLMSSLSSFNCLVSVEMQCSCCELVTSYFKYYLYECQAYTAVNRLIKAFIMNLQSTMNFCSEWWYSCKFCVKEFSDLGVFRSEWLSLSLPVIQLSQRSRLCWSLLASDLVDASEVRTWNMMQLYIQFCCQHLLLVCTHVIVILTAVVA